MKRIKIIVGVIGGMGFVSCLLGALLSEYSNLNKSISWGMAFYGFAVLFIAFVLLFAMSSDEQRASSLPPFF